MSEPLAALNRLALSLSNSFYLLPQFLSQLAPFPRAPLPLPAAACAPAPPPAAGAPPLATWGPAPRSPPPPARRPSPAPSARRGYNCFSPPGGVILGVVGGGGGGEEGNFLVPPFPGGGSRVRGHGFQVSAGGPTPGWGRPRAGVGGAGAGGLGAPGRGEMGAAGTSISSSWPFGEPGYGWGRGRRGRHLGCPIPPFSFPRLLWNAHVPAQSLRFPDLGGSLPLLCCPRKCAPWPSPPLPPFVHLHPLFMCVFGGSLSGKNLQQIESRSHHEADSFIAYF